MQTGVFRSGHEFPSLGPAPTREQDSGESGRGNISSSKSPKVVLQQKPAWLATLTQAQLQIHAYEQHPGSPAHRPPPYKSRGAAEKWGREPASSRTSLMRWKRVILNNVLTPLLSITKTKEAQLVPMNSEASSFHHGAKTWSYPPRKM